MSSIQLSYRTTGVNTTIGIYLAGSGSATITWGDSSSNIVALTSTTTLTQHTYTSAADSSYNVNISGAGITRLGGSDVNSAPAPGMSSLRTVVSFGNIPLTSLEEAFYGASNLTSVPSSLPSTVNNLRCTFRDATIFNGNVSGWNTSNVTNMDGTFLSATNFNNGSNSGVTNNFYWNVENVVIMQNMFRLCTAFNGNISGWRPGKVTIMEYMFANCANFNQNLSGWSVGEVISMKSMFENCSLFNGDVSTWRPGKVINMDTMFKFAVKFNQNLSDWNVSSVINFLEMFSAAIEFNNGQPLYTTNTAPLNWTLKTDVSLNMKNMFYNAPFSQDISTWNIQGVSTMEAMFAPDRCGMTSTLFDKMLNSWSLQTGRKTNVPFAFIKYTSAGSTALNTLGSSPSSWSITSTPSNNPVSYSPRSAYYGVNFSLTYTGALSISGTQYRLANVNTIDYRSDVFTASSNSNTYTFQNVNLNNYGMNTLSIINTTLGIIVDTLYIDVPSIALEYNIIAANTPIGVYLAGSGPAKIIWNSPQNTIVTDISLNPTTPQQYTYTYASIGTYKVDISGAGITQFGGNPPSGPSTGIARLTNVLSFGNIPTLTSFSQAFNGAINLNSVPNSLPSTVNSLYGMFRDATNFNHPNIINWDISGVTTTDSMFFQARNFNQNISNWNTRNVNNMYGMFGSNNEPGNVFNIDVSRWDTSKVTDMTNMFLRAYNFNSGGNAGVSGSFDWDVREVKGMQNMFYNCQSFNRDVSNWRPSKTTRMTSMFYNTKNFNQNLSDWVVSNVTDFSAMFQYNNAFNNGQPYYNTNTTPLNWTLKTDASVIMANMFDNTPFSQDISTWNIQSVTNMTNMFTPLAGNECGMTSTLFDKMLNSWSQQTIKKSNVPFSSIKYTSAGSSALTTLRSSPSSWNITASQVSYTPTSADYGVSFTLNYTGTVSTAGNVYRLAYASSPQAYIGNSFTGTGTAAYTFTNVVLNNFGTNNLLILDTSLNSIVDSLTINVANSIVLQYNITSADTTIGVYLAGSGPAKIKFTSSTSTYETSITELTTSPIQYTTTVVNTGTYIANIIGNNITIFGNGTTTPVASGITNLTHVLSFGDMQSLVSLSGAFFQASNLTFVPSSLPVNVTNLSNMFQGATSFNHSNIGLWNVSKVNNMNAMFASSTSNFNQNLNNWDVSRVQNFATTFDGAKQFNNGYGNGLGGTLTWDTGSALNMGGMFRNALNFNQNVSGFNVRNVTYFSDMFRFCGKFNNGQPYYITDTAPLNWTLYQGPNTINMNLVFYKSAFSQDISTWNISRVTGLSGIFTPEAASTSGITSTLGDKILKSWSQQNKIPRVTFTSVKYTSDPAAVQALATFRTVPDPSWNVGAVQVSYTPTSVNYGESFTLTYNGSATTMNRTYILVNINNPTVTISSFKAPASNQNTYTFPGVVLRDYNFSTLLIIDDTADAISDILYINTIFPCFKEGTKILTDKGYIPIEDLRNGDMVKTHIHGYKPIHMIGKRVIYNHARPEREKHQLYKCTSEHFPEVFEDLVITGCHSILVSDFTGPEQRAKSLEVNGDIFITDDKYRLPACVDDRTLVYEEVGPTPIYHLALENDNYYFNYGVFANGLLVETCSKRYLNELSHMDIVN